MRKLFLLLLLAVSCSLGGWAQKSYWPDTYNFNRGYEALQNENYEEAFEYFNKELSDNPKSGYASLFIAIIKSGNKEYGAALNSANSALKDIAKKDKDGASLAYLTRARIYFNLEENDKAIQDYNSAIKETPEDPDLYIERGNMYTYLNRYDLANKDFNKAIELAPGNVAGYICVGFIDNMEERYADAIKQFDYAIKLDASYSPAYSHRAESYIGLKDYDKAVDDIIQALSIDGNDKAFGLMQQASDSDFATTAAKFAVQTVKEPNNFYWPYCLGIVYEYNGRYKEAIGYYEKSNKIELSDGKIYRISKCYKYLGNYAKALEYADRAIALDSADYSYIAEKANLLNEMGKQKEAIAQVDKFISRYPDSYWGYASRGLYKRYGKDIDGAIEDYSMSIALNKDNADSYFGRAEMYALKGDRKAAEADYRKVIELDTIPGNNAYAMFAYLGLGQKDKAVETMNEIISKYPTDNGNYYNAACLYSKMGEADKAIDYLQTAFEKGYRAFTHIDMDQDLDAVRNLPKFKALVQKYQELHEEDMKAEAEGNDPASYEEKKIEVPFTVENGLCKVKCSINNLPLYFIFDTGASDVTISSVEATFMMKNGYLKPEDVIGQQNYQIANGEISAGTVINLRDVNFGGLDLTNVRAAVVHNQNAPLLLGQSVMNRLGNIEIDYQTRKLNITYKVKK